MSIGLRAGVSNDGYLQINGNDVMKLTPQGYFFGPVGQCVFKNTSSSACVLLPHNGNLLTINGSNYTIPSSGVTITTSGMSALTLYYIYAYVFGTTMTLEASVTGHTRDASTGIEIKTGDATRTLVGMVYTNNAVGFSNTPASRLVVSWFNRQNLLATNAAGINSTTTSATPIELNSSYRVDFVTWADEMAMFTIHGATLNNTAGTILGTQISFSSGSGGGTATDTVQVNPVANGYNAMSSSANFVSTVDRYAYVTFLSYTTGGTGTWASNFQIRGFVRG